MSNRPTPAHPKRHNRDMTTGRSIEAKLAKAKSVEDPLKRFIALRSLMSDFKVLWSEMMNAHDEAAAAALDDHDAFEIAEAAGDLSYNAVYAAKTRWITHGPKERRLYGSTGRPPKNAAKG